MRLVAKSTLVKFWSQPEYADSKGALQSWHDEAIKADWKNPQDILKSSTGARASAAITVWYSISLGTSIVWSWKCNIGLGLCE